MPENRKLPVCLLVHGYLGSPFEMEPLDAPLRDLGFEVRIPTLPGHSSNISEFRRNNFDTWSSFVESEYDKALAVNGRVIVIGLSLGGALALHLAENRSPEAAVIIDGAIFPPYAWLRQLWNWARIFIDPVRLFTRTKIYKPWWQESYAIAPWQGYDQVFHLGQFWNMFCGFCSIRKNLGRVTSPILVIHDVRDEAVTVDNAIAVIRGVSSGRCESELTRIREDVTIHHVLTTHCETKTFVINRVRSFVADVCGMAEPATWI